jgi:hypothetical protein
MMEVKVEEAGVDAGTSSSSSKIFLKKRQHKFQYKTHSVHHSRSFF